MKKWLYSNSITIILTLTAIGMIWRNVHGWGWVLFIAFVNYKDFKK